MGHAKRKSGMINVSEEIAQVFLRVGPREGYAALFAEQAEKHNERLKTLNPQDVVEIAKAQALIRAFGTDLRLVWARVEEFAAKDAADQRASISESR
jgi:hypothetical protein